ncbi:radical SAM family heme chaperone HemW [Campylobacter hominis]
MHIYIHIPFCESKCKYCAFGSFSDKFDLVNDYFKALVLEISHFNFDEKISTLFIGGGTPSVVEAKFYAPVFEILRPHFKNLTEISVEANPNSANLKWLKEMRNLGVNRISFGAQSFNNEKLKFLGRIHSAKQIENAVQNAKIAGFDNINIDLIYDTKFDTKDNLKFELKNISNLKISHISAYSLILEKGTEFYGKKSYKKDSAALAGFLFKNLAEIGFKQYEISNFGRICEHNFSYWKDEDYAGFGAYAVGTINKTRKTSPDLFSYLKNPLKKSVEILDDKDIKTERILLGMRSSVGFSREILNEKELKKAEILLQSGKILFKNDRFYNTNFLLADEIALFILC